MIDSNTSLISSHTFHIVSNTHIYTLRQKTYIQPSPKDTEVDDTEFNHKHANAATSMQKHDRFPPPPPPHTHTPMHTAAPNSLQQSRQHSFLVLFFVHHQSSAAINKLTQVCMQVMSSLKKAAKDRHLSVCKPRREKSCFLFSLQQPQKQVSHLQRLLDQFYLVNTCTHARIHTHEPTHTYTCAYTHTHIHTHML